MNVRLIAAALLMGCGVSGCVTVDAQGNRVEGPTRLDQPEGLMPGHLVLGVPQSVDADDDGIIDTIPAQVFVFATDPEYRLPIWVDAHIEFKLADESGRTLSEWTFTQEQTDSMRAIGGQIGPAYQVVLRIDDAQLHSVNQARGGWLSCRFVPVQGQPVQTDRPKSVVFGSSGRGRVMP